MIDLQVDRGGYATASVWHLIVSNEVYEDKYARPKKSLKVKTVKIPISYSIEDAIKLFTEAVQAIKRPDPKLI